LRLQPRVHEDAAGQLLPAEDLACITVLSDQHVLSKNLTLSYHDRLYQFEMPRAAYTMHGAASQRSE